MKANLVGFTRPTHLGDHATPLDLITYCARVSNPNNQENLATAKRLVAYLIEHKHWSPFEMANAVVEVETTRDIARQLLRHRSFSFQEYSTRYAHTMDDMPFVLRDCRMQDTKNRQNSYSCDDPVIRSEWYRRQQELLEMVTKHYNWGREQGIAKEQLRSLLPEGLTPSRLYVNGTIRSWIHYIEVRTEQGTQEEHIILARAIAEAISSIFPMSEFAHEHDKASKESRS